MTTPSDDDTHASGDASARPFDGIRIVEFGQFIAVPFCAQLLAEGGAEVIKIEALTGDPTRAIAQLAPMETRTFVSRNRGKRSLPLKLGHPDSKPVIAALLDWADVVLTNFRPGTAERLNLDGETLLASHPKLIVGNVSAFGMKGPDAGFAGMDIVVQARSGLMAANGRIRDGRPAAGDPVVADYMCAMTLAYGISAALLRRERTGRGGQVNTSLMQAAMTLANNQLIRAESVDAPKHDAVLERLAELRAAGASFAEQAEVLPTGRSMPMLRIYFRTYATADGNIAIACGSHKLRLAFMAALGLQDEQLETVAAGGSNDYYDTLQPQVEALFASQPTDHWLAILNEAGVPVAPVKFPIELFDDDHVDANDMLHTLDHPSIGPMRVVAPPLQIDGQGFQPAPPVAPFASETDDLLTALGFDADATEALVTAGVTHRNTPGDAD